MVRSGRERGSAAAALAFLLSLSLVAACSGAPPGASPSPPATATPSASPSGAIPHPTSPTAVVLRLEEVGGLRPPSAVATDVPRFTLYGDRSVVFAAPQPETTDVGSSRPPLLRMVASESRVQELLAFALGPGGLRGARETYRHERIADAPTTVFTLNADGLDKSVAVEALGIRGPETPDAEERQAFQRLVDRIDDFRALAAAGELGEVAPYDPPLYLVRLLHWEGVGAPIDWPWPDLSISDFEAADEFAGRVRQMERERVAELAAVPTAGLSGVRTVDPEGASWTIAIRPLLPEELGEVNGI